MVRDAYGVGVSKAIRKQKRFVVEENRKRSEKEYWDLRARVVRDASGVGVFKNN